MSYTVQGIKKYNEWKKDDVHANGMVFPALLSIYVGGAAVKAPIESLSTPGIVLDGALALYGKERVEGLLNNLNSDLVQNRLNEAIEGLSKEEARTR